MNIKLIIEQELNEIISEYERLGKGGFGIAYKKADKDIDKDVVQKITTDRKEAFFSQLIKNNQDKLTTFVKIYKVFYNIKRNKFFISREIVKPIKDVLKPTEIARIDANVYKLRKYIYSGDEEILGYIKNSKISDDFIDFLINLRKDLKTIGSKHYVDFHSGNIGINEDGNFVLFDF